jgi:hypothetical protein
MGSFENIAAVNEAMKYLQGGRISDTFSKWICKVRYSEGKGISATLEKSEYEVEFMYDSNNPKVGIPEFEGLNRHPEFQSRFSTMNIAFDEKDAVLTIRGRSQKTSKDYELAIFLRDARKLA